MDLQTQARIKQLAEEAGTDNLMVVMGALDVGAVELWGQTLTTGDPTYAGPLAGVPLGLPVYHILEPKVKEHIPPEVYEAQVGMMEMVLDVEKLSQVVERIRRDGSKMA